MKRFLYLLTIGFSVLHGQYTVAQSCSNKTGQRPFPMLAAGTVNAAMPIDHIVILMQENHSFDNYFGRLNQAKFYGSEVDGVLESMTNPTTTGELISAHHEPSLCVADPEHGWNAIHAEWNQGALDGFVKVNGAKAMGYFDERDLPFYYDLANKFAIADRYFCGALTQTLPNRFYLYTGTSFGHIRNDMPEPKIQFSQKTIFDVLNDYGISWKYYRKGPGYLPLFQPLYLSNRDKMATLDDYRKDLATGKLPSVALLDAAWDGSDEHPDANVQEGQKFVADRIQELVASSAWPKSVFFLTYDENGGFFDHVAPPEACVPDSIAPMLEPDDIVGAFDRYGFRVPFVAVSPFVKHHFVSHKVYDHTSILKFIETKFNLPALTARDANADDMSDLFDWSHPDVNVKPDFSLATVSGKCPVR